MRYFPFLFKRCFWLYLAIGIIITKYALDPTPIPLTINYLNGMKIAESQIISALKHNERIDSRDCYDAIQYYKSLMDFIGPSDYMFANMGFCYYHLGQIDTALAMYRQAGTLNPLFYIYDFDQAIIYLIQGQYETAAFYFTQSEKKMDDTIALYDYIGKEIPSEYRSYFNDHLPQQINTMSKDLSVIRDYLGTFAQLKNQKNYGNVATDPDKGPKDSLSALLHFEIFIGCISTEMKVLLKAYQDEKAKAPLPKKSSTR